MPCCLGFGEAAKKGHVTCVKHILKDGCSMAEADRAAAVEDLDPLASMYHFSHSRCSKIDRLLLEAGLHPDGAMETLFLFEMLPVLNSITKVSATKVPASSAPVY